MLAVRSDLARVLKDRRERQRQRLRERGEGEREGGREGERERERETETENPLSVRGKSPPFHRSPKKAGWRTHPRGVVLSLAGPGTGQTVVFVLAYPGAGGALGTI